MLIAAYDEPDLTKRNYPLFWDMKNACMEGGKFVHFPRGTYHEQMSTEFGRIELELMKNLYHTGLLIHRRKTGWPKYSRDEIERDIEIFKGLGWTLKQIYSPNGLSNLPDIHG